MIICDPISFYLIAHLVVQLDKLYMFVQVVLTSLVYEKQQKLRIMMKMHGLGDGPYWMISYGYFLAISIIYMLCFVIFGSLLGKNITIELFSLLGIFSFSLILLTLFSGLKIFTINDYSIQFVFYFIYINLQIALAFLVASIFSNVKTATGLMIATFLLFIIMGVLLFSFPRSD